MKITKRVIVPGALAIVAVLGSLYLWGPSAVPAGQEPLAALPASGASPFEQAFDTAAKGTRVVLLLSPT